MVPTTWLTDLAPGAPGSTSPCLPILCSVLLLTTEEPSPRSVRAGIDKYSWPCIFMAPETAARHKVPEQVQEALNMV